MKIIGICGRARTGKDTLANIIKEYTNVTIIPLAYYLKKVAIRKLGLNSIEELDYYKNNNIYYNNINIRKYLQNLADVLLCKHGNNYFIDKVVSSINKTDTEYVVIPDIRKKIELEQLKKTYPDMLTIKTERSNFKIKESDHPSETEVDMLETDIKINIGKYSSFIVDGVLNKQDKNKIIDIIMKE